MEAVSLELKLISCRHLKSFNFFQKPSVYAVVCIFRDEDDNKKQEEQRQKTPVDRKGGANPEWNHRMLFDLRSIQLQEHVDNLFLKFELRYEGIVFGNKTIGEVCVPFKDLIGDLNGSLRYVSYQVRNSDRKANGVLNFSYKVNGKATKIGSVDSAKAKLGSGVNCSTEKVHYPSLEIQVQPRKACLYPSLDDIYSPSAATVVPSLESYYPVKAVVPVAAPPPPPPPQFQTFAVGNEAYYYPYPSPVTHPAGPCWHTAETWLRSA
ncbi:hypothetical protein Tsubulata_000729 [Turnera subulata]|uniref:C2 domain-containing protein n=1 Tax=Turnera subulata TaxID=218843 RepID=A0A9Q0J3B4_9ROSI|nr:hypothetical protein Tsubulata_000729 [Turnera subulata]